MGAIIFIVLSIIGVILFGWWVAGCPSMEFRPLGRDDAHDDWTQDPAYSNLSGNMYHSIFDEE